MAIPNSPVDFPTKKTVLAELEKARKSTERKLEITFKEGAFDAVTSILRMMDRGMIFIPRIGDVDALKSFKKSHIWKHDRDRTVTIVLLGKFNSAWFVDYATYNSLEKIAAV